MDIPNFAQAIPPELRYMIDILEQLRTTDLRDPDTLTNTMFKFSQQLKSNFSPLKNIPCAHAQSQATLTFVGCEKPGTMACSACKLVAYCSRECQNAHWKEHKKFCKSYMRSDDWIPEWNDTGRKPDFTLSDTYNPCDPEGGHNGESMLWNRLPPVDLINLKDNEKNSQKDFDLAFLASGDLRNVMKTINSLPSDFSGKLNIVLNDPDPDVALRNALILLVLGRQPDIDLAADIALQFWFSLCLPTDYTVKLGGFGNSFRDHLKKTDLSEPYPLDGGATGPVVDGSTLPKSGSSISLGCSLELLQLFLIRLNVPKLSTHAQAEYDRVRMDPSRKDSWDRMYTFLRPSHRVAMHTYRRSGLLLPFGAVNAHFNMVNTTLFSPDGKWLQADNVTPLQGWNIAEVVEAGQAHGAHPEDIFGCLYFYLSSQLRTLAHRIRTFNISFNVFTLEPDTLSQCIRSNMFQRMGLSSALRFDRIDVSDAMDSHDGVRPTPTAWAPLLREGEHSAVVGRFEEWGKMQKNGRCVNAGNDVCGEAIVKLMEKTEHIFHNAWDRLGISRAASYGLMTEADVVYDNSGPFAEFLEKQRLNYALQTTKLYLRRTHRIVPHRVGVPLAASSSALPELADDDAWYYYTKLTRYSWAERFVEFGWHSAEQELGSSGNSDPTVVGAALLLAMLSMNA